MNKVILKYSFVQIETLGNASHGFLFVDFDFGTQGHQSKDGNKGHHDGRKLTK